MDEEKESANNSKPEPLITENDDHQDKNVDHDHHDQQTMENKSASDEQVQVQHQDDHQDRPYKCPNCDNRYKTRRALYGHKKKHNEKRKRIDSDSDSDFDADDEEDEEEESGDAISPPREKSLRSKKSPFAQTSSSSSNPPPPGNWSVTAKRSGGKSTNLVSPTSSNLINEKETEAVIGLVELSREKPEAHTELGSIIDRREENKAEGVKDKEGEEEEEHPCDFDLREEEFYENEERRKKTKLIDERAATEYHDKDDDNNNGGCGDHVSDQKGDKSQGWEVGLRDGGQGQVSSRGSGSGFEVRVVVWFQGQGPGHVLRWRSGSRFGMGVGVGFRDGDQGRVLGQDLGSSFRTRFGSGFRKWVGVRFQDRGRGWVSGFTPFLH
ncbi:hypothetical protein TIFTF001_028959 [Ficus carica]|uniref:C2H2-type domain-containing protein n=1 Tax=Ficus carica TaxID=3494 RepID=A0AA88DQW5_FICCA|nr:hypothetical protein TIFTF001_028959 [Ficus carica]